MPLRDVCTVHENDYLPPVSELCRFVGVAVRSRTLGFAQQGLLHYLQGLCRWAWFPDESNLAYANLAHISDKQHYVRSENILLLFKKFGTLCCKY